MDNQLSTVILLFLELFDFGMGDYFQEPFIFVKEEIEFFWFEHLLALVVGVGKENQRSEVRTLRYLLNYCKCLQEFRDCDLAPTLIGKQLKKSLLGFLREMQ